MTYWSIFLHGSRNLSRKAQLSLENKTQQKPNFFFPFNLNFTEEFYILVHAGFGKLGNLGVRVEG